MTRGRLWVVVLLVSALFAVVGVVLVRRMVFSDDLAAQATVSASSVANGTSPRQAVTSSGTARPRPGWRSDHETTGAWIELQWRRAQDLRRVVIIRNGLTQPGITTGFLSFSDNSDVQVKLSTSSARTVVPIAARSVNRMRFTASGVDPGATDVSLVSLRVGDQTRNDDVDITGPSDGNVAVEASDVKHANGQASDARALLGAGRGAVMSWTVPRPAGAWVQLDWTRPRELTTVQVVGSRSSASAVRSGTLTFSDGSQLSLGAVLNDPERPTTTSFMPRVTTSVRLTIDTLKGDGTLVLARIRTYQRGGSPARPAGKAVAELREPDPANCPASAPPNTSQQLVVLCPTNGAVVTGRVSLRVSAPGRSSVSATVWPSEVKAAGPPTSSATPGASGAVTLGLDLRRVPSGPLTVRLEARGGPRPPEATQLQLFRAGRQPGGDPSASGAARGRTLVYDEEFDRPLSISRTGAAADYAAAKPTAQGAEDFGSAIFPDPALGFDTVQVVDGRYLRIQVRPRPRGFVDPQGYGRKHVGGLLASARTGGSGFSAQYGYFEARILAPAARGTWPAFWMLPSANLVAPQALVAEIDAVELYGHDPKATCQTTHEYANGRDAGVARCGTRFDSVRAAVGWHTYGVSVGPISVSYFIDGRLVATIPQVRGGGEPMFFLVDLALGGGWPVNLASTRGSADLYVDYVRVYV